MKVWWFSDAVAHIGKLMLEGQERIFDLWHPFLNKKLDRAVLSWKTGVINEGHIGVKRRRREGNFCPR